jgi:hypothetical protein
VPLVVVWVVLLVVELAADGVTVVLVVVDLSDEEEAVCVR